MPKRKRDYNVVQDRRKRRRIAPRSNVVRVARTLKPPEMKYFDSAGAINMVSNTDWTGCEMDPVTLNTLFAPTQGDNSNNREGKQVTVWKIKIRGHLTVAAQVTQAAGDTANYGRVIFVLDKQTNAAQLNSEDVIDGSVIATAPMVSFQNVSFFGRFNVIADKIFTFADPNLAGSPTTGDVVQGGLVRVMNFSKKYKNGIRVRFNNTNGGTVADILDNSWHLIGNQLSGSLDATYSYKCRVYFTE